MNFKPYLSTLVYVTNENISEEEKPNIHENFPSNFESKENIKKPFSFAQKVKRSRTNKRFDLKDDLTQPSIKQEVKRPYSCVYCDINFTKKSYLQRHQLKIHQVSIHKRKKSWQCQMCDKEFRSRSELREHKKEIHDKDKPHECNYCHSRFSMVTFSKKKHKNYSP